RPLVRLPAAIEVAMLYEYGEGSLAVGFDRRGAVLLGTAAISGNPYLYIDRHEPHSGALLAHSEVWQQVWSDDVEVDRYDPTGILSPARIPEGERVVHPRRDALELWSAAGLLGSWPIGLRCSVIPAFDPGNFCLPHELWALFIEDEALTLLDLAGGVLHPWRPHRADGGPLGVDDLRWCEFIAGVPALWTDDELILWSTDGHDRRLRLPPGRVEDQTLTSVVDGRLHLLILDDQGGLWSGTLELPIAPAMARPRKPEPTLERLAATLERLPGDSEAFAEHVSVWADALLARGDVRGQLILLQLAGKSDQAQALLHEHADILLPGLRTLPPERAQLRWKPGYLHTASFLLRNREELAEVLVLLASESARLIESLEIHFTDDMQKSYRLEFEDRLDAYLHAAQRWPLLAR
ncbi:MAG: hypothetical protein KC431_28945, partial [Myxococcales bacterium]|nr:hypothetical protein [Myxococcales bacterium]